MADRLTARLVEWNSEKRYGFLRAGSQRVFIHIHDFTELHKQPEAGDVIQFSLGTDKLGRR